MTRPRIFFENDSRHTLIYMYEPPIQAEEEMSAVDEIVGTPVEALVFNLGYGNAFLHGTDVADRWGPAAAATEQFRPDGGARWNHMVFQRAYRNAAKLIAEGNDPLRLICDRAHEKGLLVYPSLQLPIALHRDQDRVLTIGAAGAAPDEASGQADYAQRAVRDQRLAIIAEAVANYPLDGFELNFSFYGRSHFFHPDQVEIGRGIMTDWLAAVRDVVKKGNPDRELAVRLGTSIDGALTAGLDPAAWMQQGLVDVVTAENFALMSQIDVTADFRPLVEAASGSGCRVIAGLRNQVDSDRLSHAPVEMVRAAATNYWEQGVDGISLIHWYGNWPYDSAFYEQLRELPHPEIMAAKDKFYFVPTPGGHMADEAPIDRGLSWQLPVELPLGEPASLRLPISDDLDRWHRVGRVHEVVLRLRLHAASDRDRYTFELNGSELPAAITRTISHVYMLNAPRCRSHPSYWFIFKLGPELWPRRGANVVEVTLLERDEEAAPPVAVRDVELEIKYLRGKSYFRGALYTDPDLGPYQQPLR